MFSTQCASHFQTAPRSSVVFSSIERHSPLPGSHEKHQKSTLAWRLAGTSCAFFPAGNIGMKLIQQEQEWRRPPEPQKLPSGREAQVIFARWSASEAGWPLECFSDQADASHVVSLALKPTKSELIVGRKNMKAGPIRAGTTFVAGPISQPCSTVFFEAFDFLQVYLSPALMEECFEAIHGRAPKRGRRSLLRRP
jgi:hypothetical protein